MKNTGKYQSHEVLRNQQPVVVLTPTCRRVKVFVLIPLFCSCDLILALWPCWYSRVFLQDLEGCLEAPEGVGACFLERVRRYKCWSCVGFFRFTSFVCSCIHIFRTDFSSMCPQKESFQMYECYCQNKPRSEALWRQFSDCSFFQVRSSRDFSFPLQFCLINFSVSVVTDKYCIHCGFICLPGEGVSKKAGAQTGPGFLPVETDPTPHQIPAAA